VSRDRSWRHAAAFAAFTLLAIAQTWPLAAHLSTHLPGTHVGDNAAFAWNIWWMRQAIERPGVSFFTTDAIFKPDGVSLVLHTHTALGAAAVAPLRIDAITACNLLVIVCVALNGFTAYALANLLGGSHSAAMLAGVLFLGAPPLTTRLMGHFNLLYAWTLVAAIALTIAASRRRTSMAWTVAGAAVGVVAWADYYLFVYTIALLGIVALAYRPHWRVTRHRRPNNLVRSVSIGFLTVVLMIGMVVLISGGFVLHLATLEISMRSATNIFTIAWAIAIACVLATWRIEISRTSGAGLEWKKIALAATACALVMAPLALHAAMLVASGDYVAPAPLWRSAPPGADLLTFVLGPPWHSLIGPGVRDAYDAMHIDVMEMSGWLGAIGPVLAIIASRQYRGEPAVRAVRIATLVFLVWSLGAFLHIAGVNIGLLLPQQVGRFVPIVSNVRMPTRALIIVSLAIALLAARWARDRRQGIVWLMCALVFVEQLAAPLPLAALTAREVDRELALLPGGVVLELPFGYRDGFGSSGHFDASVMLAQMVHGHPIVGGFVARLPPRIAAKYTSNKTLEAVRRVSVREQAALPSCAESLRDLNELGVRYIIAPREGFAPWLGSIPLTGKGADESRELYELGTRCP
jgi:hypothetical protein